MEGFKNFVELMDPSTLKVSITKGMHFLADNTEEVRNILRGHRFYADCRGPTRCYACTVIQVPGEGRHTKRFHHFIDVDGKRRSKQFSTTQWGSIEAARKASIKFLEEVKSTLPCYQAATME